ncbi:MAG: hypothetical protein QW600_00960 [Candidatus Bathyarchaeia archaeon]|nr:hypothetical protein [Candidatus Bathyarchaeota archaeon]
MSSSGNLVDKVGPLMGISVFLIGIILLAFTFYAGIMYLYDPSKLAAFAELIPVPEFRGEENPLIQGIAVIATRIIAYIIPILIIFVLGYIASKITAQGIQMYRTRPLAPRKEEAKSVEGELKEQT